MEAYFVKTSSHSLKILKSRGFMLAEVAISWTCHIGLIYIFLRCSYNKAIPCCRWQWLIDAKTSDEDEVVMLLFNDFCQGASQFIITYRLHRADHGQCNCYAKNGFNCKYAGTQSLQCKQSTCHITILGGDANFCKSIESTTFHKNCKLLPCILTPSGYGIISSTVW